MGEQLAKIEMFLFFTTVVQQIRFSIAPGQVAPSYDSNLDILRRPKDYQVVMSSWDD